MNLQLVNVTLPNRGLSSEHDRAHSKYRSTNWLPNGADLLQAVIAEFGICHQFPVEKLHKARFDDGAGQFQDQSHV